MGQNRRHLEFFGPDMQRVPPLSGSPPVAAVQIATALAQLRAPILRDDTEIESHANYIRALADRLFPDYAVSLNTSVGVETGNSVATTIRINNDSYSLLYMWLSDTSGGGVTGTAPDSVSFSSGTILETIVANKQYLVLAPDSGIVTVNVNFVGADSWYWGITRFGRVYYTNQLNFT